MRHKSRQYNRSQYLKNSETSLHEWSAFIEVAYKKNNERVTKTNLGMKHNNITPRDCIIAELRNLDIWPTDNI